jgi:uncharacterized protein with LGFP repeats
MNSKILFVAITIIAAFGTAASVVGLATLSPVAAQDNMTMMTDENMTGMGNMTGGNMTGGNMTLG